MSKRGENIYKRKDGRWEARHKQPDGKYVSTYGKTYSEAKKKLREKLQKMGDFKQGEQNQRIIEQLNNWLNECAKRVKLSTYENYYYCMKTYVWPFFEETKNNTINKANLNSFVEKIYTNQMLSDASRKKILTIFKIALKFIMKENQFKSDLLKSMKIPKTQSRIIQVFEANEQIKVEQELIKTRNLKAVGILLCFYTGLRLGELCAVKWSNIDHISKTITITGTLSRKKNFDSGSNKTKLHISSPKNNSSQRCIPLPQFLAEVLKDCATQASDHDSYLLSNTHAPIDPRTVQRFYERILQKANVRYRKFHTVRHTFATRALEMGIDVKTVSDLLGHSSVTTTLNIYAHSLMEQKKKAIAMLNDLHLTNISL